MWYNRGIADLYAMEGFMPEISRFHGIKIRMYYDDQHHPHFHAYYGEYVALFTIDPPALYEGNLPRRQQHIVLGWAEVH
ncbi:MAG: DUF4160 domain-containing protein [Caldilineaceae bacterium]|nr:DUF4160 domain-containing protein [Caldilineaceae bacterium]